MLDAPCTGIGSLRRRPDARWRRSESDLKELIALQRGLLDQAAKILAPGGIIFYMTCSPHPLETLAQVSDFLRRHADFSIAPITMKHMTSMAAELIAPAIRDDGSLQLLTKALGTDAMFMVMLKKEDLG
jgi:16S rRNA (cytosine967-C5)-methyltransferase